MRWLGLILGLLSIGPAAAAGWQDDLAEQLRLEHDCQLAFLSGVVERQVEGRALVIAKAHCEDGRVFDALQPDASEAFELNECTADEQGC
jgi:hypothetical protein